MTLVIIGTDHRLQQSVVLDEKTKAWVPRTGGRRDRKLIAYCVEKLGAKAILEETHDKQERTAPTIASSTAKSLGVVWQSLGLGEPGFSDILADPHIVEAVRSGMQPEFLAGRYELSKHKTREDFISAAITQAMQKHDCVLAIVGFVHLGVLARIEFTS